jgi:hypothetical protein
MGQRLRKRYGKVRDHLFTFLDHPEVAADNNGSERELRPTATYRKVTGGFRSGWGATYLPQSAPSSEPPPAEASMPIRPSGRPYAGNPFSNRVEQLLAT